ncbi:MAG: FAD-dependent oxidoreductase [Mangrovibacterium sp.]
MDRRTFLNLGLPVAGAVMVSPAWLNAQVRAEITRQFSIPFSNEGYDLVINGAGLAGYFAAVEAAKKGLSVLIVEKRSSPGFDIAAKMRLWIGADGLDLLDQELTDLFLPEQEKREVFRSEGTGPQNSLYGDELLLLSGTVRKGMLRNLLVNRTHILLMTDVCGVFTTKGQVQGVLLACKQGLFSIKCRHFIDASDNLLFSRNLSGKDCRIDRAGFVLELLQAGAGTSGKISVPETLGLLKNQISLYPGKNANHQVFAAFEFPVKGQGIKETELKARKICAVVGEILPQLDPALQRAKIHQYALECTLFLKDSTPPKTDLENYHLLASDQHVMTVRTIVSLRESARNLISGIKPVTGSFEWKELRLPGRKIPVKAISFSDVDDPGLAVPLKRCSFDFRKYVTHIHDCEVLVGGGGTSGALAGIGSSERGAKTIVTDYFNDLGGSKTLGGVMGYYHGLKDHTVIKRLEQESGAFAKRINASGRIARQLFLLDRLADVGGQFIPGAMICGTLSKANQVEGILVCCNGKLEIINAGLTIDGTGDGDIASFAGAAYDHGNFRNGLTQNYSQWNIQGGGKPPSSVTSDYGIIDNRMISEIQRGLFLAHYEAHFYDFHPFLTIRESRRVKGLYELNVTDAMERTHFEDVVAMASSDFDPHYIGNSEFTRCGFLLPHSNDVIVEIPYRSLVPQSLDGILISGKAFSQTQNTYQFTRMSADLTVLGYVTGQIAAEIVREKVQPRQFKVSRIQREWITSAYLPEERMSLPAGNKTSDTEEINRRITGLAQGYQEYLPACCNLPPKQVIPLLKEGYSEAKGEGKLLTAKALAWFGDASGIDRIEEDLKDLFSREQATDYPGGYIENYDFIRGREKNILEGLFWKINQDIALLALSGSNASNGTIREVLEKTTSGGEPITWTGDRANYFNERIDLRIVPFHNRIYNLCFYVERNPHPMFIKGLEDLLSDTNINKRICKDYSEARWKIYGGDLELYIGATLARCGGEEGYYVLVEYLSDIHYNFKHYAVSELESLTGQHFGYHHEKWLNYLRRQTYPRTTVPAQRKKEA